MVRAHFIHKKNEKLLQDDTLGSMDQDVEVHNHLSAFGIQCERKSEREFHFTFPAN